MLNVNRNTNEIGCSVGPQTFFFVFLVFLVLKLTDQLQWDWIWVTSPLWICLGIGLIFILGFALGYGLALIITSFWEIHRYKTTIHWIGALFMCFWGFTFGSISIAAIYYGDWVWTNTIAFFFHFFLFVFWGNELLDRFYLRRLFK